jgi:hypothetical protein
VGALAFVDAGAPAIRHTNQREEKEIEQLDKPANLFFFFLNFTLVLLRRRLTKGIQSRAHLYYVIDRKTINTIKTGR